MKMVKLVKVLESAMALLHSMNCTSINQNNVIMNTLLANTTTTTTCTCKSIQ